MAIIGFHRSAAPAVPALPAIPVQNGESQQAQRLEIFRKDYCPGIESSQVKERIEQGEELQAALISLANDCPKDENNEIAFSAWNAALKGLAPEHKSKEAIVSLLWLLTSKTAGQGEGKMGDLYTNGAMRLVGGEVNGQMLEAYLIVASGGDAYGRISSHLKETLKDGNGQWGVDLRDMGLPASKQHLLFVAQKDGSIYLKMERYGCPPFWKKGFRTLPNFLEFVGHSMTFVTSRPAVSKVLNALHISASVPEMKAKRKEHLSAELKVQYRQAIEDAFPAIKQTFWEKIAKGYALDRTPEQAKAAEKREHAKELLKSGLKEGVTKMVDNLEKELAGSLDSVTCSLLSPTLQNLRDARAKVLGSVKEKNVGDIAVKGNEVVLPPLSIPLGG